MMKRLTLSITDEQDQFLRTQHGSRAAWIRAAIDERREQGAKLQALIDKLEASFTQTSKPHPLMSPVPSGALVGLRRGVGED